MSFCGFDGQPPFTCSACEETSDDDDDEPDEEDEEDEEEERPDGSFVHSRHPEKKEAPTSIH